MQVNVQKLSEVLVEFAVEIPADRVRAEVERAYAELARSARISGFRKGKTPRNVLAQLYGARVESDVARRLMDETLPKAIEEKNVTALQTVEVVPGKLLPTGSFTYKARFEVPPDIEKVNYEGFELTRPSTAVTPAAVDAELEELRKQHSVLKAPEPPRASKSGDGVIIDFDVTIDGKPVPDGSGQGIETELGSGNLLKELDDAIVGLSVGEQKEVTVTFSASHKRDDFRGKTGVFKVTLKELKERVLPNLDDEFAKDIGEEFGGAETLDALKKALEERVKKELEQRADDAVAQQLVNELCKANPVAVPPSLVQKQMEITAEELQQQARRSGQRFQLTADLRKQLEVDSIVKVRAGLLMAAIARSEGVKIVDEDLEKAYVELAEMTGKNVARIKAEYRDQQKREMLFGMILEDKILDIIQAKAKITQLEAS